jgi:hypothetical protein
MNKSLIYDLYEIDPENIVLAITLNKKIEKSKNLIIVLDNINL